MVVRRVLWISLYVVPLLCLLLGFYAHVHHQNQKTTSPDLTQQLQRVHELLNDVQTQLGHEAKAFSERKEQELKKKKEAADAANKQKHASKRMRATTAQCVSESDWTSVCYYENLCFDGQKVSAFA